MFNSKFFWFITFSVFTATAASGGVVLLMGVGGPIIPAPPPPPCSNTLDFTDACNSQYFTAIGN